MAAQRIVHLCNNVEALAYTLEKLSERASSDRAQTVLLRMRLAALTTELIATDLIERVRQPSALSDRTVR
jgi:hypothetical protein